VTEAHAEPRPTGDTGGQADGTTRGTLLFAGDVFCDVVFSGVTAPEQGAEVFADAFAITPGGVANRAVAAARAGAPTMLASRLGDDVLGRHVYDVLTAEPFLDTSLLELVPGHQSAVSVALTGPDDRSFITYEEHLGPTVVPDDLGPVAATHVGIARPLPAWVGWDHTGEWSGGVLDRLAEVDVFVPNDVEAMRYTRTDSALAAAKVLAERVPLAVVTRGPDGVVAVDSANGVVVTAETIRVEAVDPTGAGDVFVAAFMAGVHHGWDLETRLRFAAASAAFAVTGLGGAASAPHPDELRTFLDQRAAPGDWSFLADVPSTDSR
jgi:sugar/nucleoside kinase (ribokinase family)